MVYTLPLCLFFFFFYKIFYFMKVYLQSPAYILFYIAIVVVFGIDYVNILL